MSYLPHGQRVIYIGHQQGCCGHPAGSKIGIVKERLGDKASVLEETYHLLTVLFDDGGKESFYKTHFMPINEEILQDITTYDVSILDTWRERA